MTKRVLVVHYSQTGQLDRVAQRCSAALQQHEQITVQFEQLRPETEFPFPWPVLKFFDTMPECVYLDPPPLQPLALDGSERFDLVIIAYQVWFLSPSLPITAFLQSSTAAKVLKDTPVVTVIACRNMWLHAQEEMKKLLENVGAKLVGNIALVDEVSSLMSFVSTPLWVLTGNKGPWLGGRIPRAGVAEKEIINCERFGQRIADTLCNDEVINKDLLSGLAAVRINESLMASEKLGRRSFRIWGGLLRMVGSSGSWARVPVLIIYALFLLLIITTFVPVSMLLNKILRPLMAERIEQQREYFALPSGE